MAPATPGGASGFLILAGTELCLLATAAFADQPRARPTAHPHSPSIHTRTRKPTWRTGPASMPLETEVVPPHPPSVPPPVRTITLSVQGEPKDREEAGRKPSAASTAAAMRTPNAPVKSGVTIDDSHSGAGDLDPGKRALGELNCLRHNPDARQAFYDDLRRTVERVRAGNKDENEKKPTPCGP